MGPGRSSPGRPTASAKPPPARLAADGCNVVLVARRAGALAGVADGIGEAHGVSTRVVAADLASPDEASRVDRETRDLDVGLLFAAAGFGTSGPFVEADLGRELGMIDVNCRALVQLTHAFARRFAARGAGGIVLMSSLVAFQGVPRAATYAATKALVQTFAEGLAREVEPLGIDVLASAPGPVDERLRRALRHGDHPRARRLTRSRRER